ncbi:alpha-L-fucosidase [Arachidicoccus terrestris]|uniref:alpha-L-fucosidase n=1 Tax=Arachidicoccus terrestris TaxID=2875539 RepID=UPI001CC763BE|nr:alpha-L-fucosidase [Arachidicoccus terrestris]UAY54181.1 alpha-L-fucosidase [Arachidicoccus terrestris]
MKRCFLFLFFSLITMCGFTQGMEDMWDSSTTGKTHPNIHWFNEAKFGLFIHWGLYSKLAGTWNGKHYYGSGEWIMNQAKIPVKDYRKIAASFNPVKFNADQWAQLAQDAGVRYLVITAKHHEGFSMFDSKVTDYDIVDATPYKKDPMKALAVATRKRGIQFGFYYSQFQDWYEPNGGRNTWDYDESKKDYQLYYQRKSIPQLKELLSNYGPLGIVWFDTPGGMTKAETEAFVNELRRLQPRSLFSSRVGQGLGDYRDFGDSEVPPTPIGGAWESIYTHNDTWGYIAHDFNFKSPKEIIQLLANVASKGGNLMLNVGPDGDGNIPYYSAKFLKETGKWLKENGESIYGTTAGFIPVQPWGVTTAKPGKLFLHVFKLPLNDTLLVPGFSADVSKVYTLMGKSPLGFSKRGRDLYISLTSLQQSHSPNTVFVVEYKGSSPAYNAMAPVTVSSTYEQNPIHAANAQTKGKARVQSLTYSYYYGDWKHTTCVTDMSSPNDAAEFSIRVTDPGDYRFILEYACPKEQAGQEGCLEIAGKTFFFRTLRTSDYDRKVPLMFIKHSVALYTVEKPGVYHIVVKPYKQGKELFKLKSIIAEPI